LHSITFEGRAMPVNLPSSSDALVRSIADPLGAPSPAIPPRFPVPRSPLPDVDFGLSGE
jgi:hypothetical protein